MRRKLLGLAIALGAWQAQAHSLLTSRDVFGRHTPLQIQFSRDNKPLASDLVAWSFQDGQVSLLASIGGKFHAWEVPPVVFKNLQVGNQFETVYDRLGQEHHVLTPLAIARADGVKRPRTLQALHVAIEEKGPRFFLSFHAERHAIDGEKQRLEVFDFHPDIDRASTVHCLMVEGGIIPIRLLGFTHSGVERQPHIVLESQHRRFLSDPTKPPGVYALEHEYFLALLPDGYPTDQATPDRSLELVRKVAVSAWESKHPLAAVSRELQLEAAYPIRLPTMILTPQRDGSFAIHQGHVAALGDGTYPVRLNSMEQADFAFTLPRSEGALVFQALANGWTALPKEGTVQNAEVLRFLIERDEGKNGALSRVMLRVKRDEQTEIEIPLEAYRPPVSLSAKFREGLREIYYADGATYTPGLLLGVAEVRTAANDRERVTAYAVDVDALMSAERVLNVSLVPESHVAIAAEAGNGPPTISMHSIHRAVGPRRIRSFPIQESWKGLSLSERLVKARSLVSKSIEYAEAASRVHQNVNFEARFYQSSGCAFSLWSQSRAKLPRGKTE